MATTTATPAASSSSSSSSSALPMPTPTNNPPLPLHKYKVLSFDVYGTLVEYKRHILTCFEPLLSQLPQSSPYLDPRPLSSTIFNCATVGQIEFLKLFQRTEDAVKLERPPLPRFDAVLAEIWRRVARELGVVGSSSDDQAQAFGSESNVASWPVFPGTLDSLQRLAQRYRLVALSNIDRFAWEITARSGPARLGEVEWWKVFTAEDFGDDGDDADEAKLRTLLEFCRENGVEREEILHVAQSLGHDHAPAKRLGLSSVFLIGDGSRWGKEVESKMVLEKDLVGYAWRCRDLKEFASIVDGSGT